jgi:uncharacterized OB-fold protein
MRCEPCDLWYAPDASGCPECGAEELTWAQASGLATLATWTVSHGRPAEYGTAPEPAVLALVELAEGPWLYARLDGIARDDLAEGLALRACFEHPAEGESYLLFTKASRPWTE